MQDGLAAGEDRAGDLGRRGFDWTVRRATLCVRERGGAMWSATAEGGRRTHPLASLPPQLQQTLTSATGWLRSRLGGGGAGGAGEGAVAEAAAALRVLRAWAC